MTEGKLSIQKLNERFPNTVLDATDFRGEATVVVRAADIPVSPR